MRYTFLYYVYLVEL
ncbi:hypothetical protein DDE82_009148 [Stemphylium lycopersici]|nr:hypothetical protein DDE82_009148 [Stemphylium lycopersici]